MRISDWSSDVCSSDLPSAMRCEAANDKNFIDIVRRLAPISRHRILPTVGMARSVIYNSATSADAGRQCRRGVVPDSNLEACDGRSEEHTSEIQSLMRTSSAVFRLNKQHNTTTHTY